ncbi:DUF1499 domain-containing protein [Pararhizobium antarcticum]|uniref:DUF1499 domain-containing protein n=1 Tax=Pararhizobium antarcticum TaxID=1798805 RepID=A0A657LVA1_9HYPH|nr:DUF1499 domain-containing protein [Pararhizobium antarcticum]OJF98726.1 hypothetical protein AX760_01415 [Pararhizobium antarcticum]OJF98886.1 hypothetical protein AX760_02395 [Pararhizobium antarcticum]OJF99147.1 hypothetical protein AX761_11845 [Rhizobium sp. 58]
MMIKYERPISQTAVWARHLARFSFGFLAVALLAHRFGPLTTPHFLALCAVSAGLALLAVALAIIGFVRLWQVAAVGGIAAFMALVYAAGPLGFAGVELAAYFSRPAIYDVTTDTQAPPSWIIPPDAAQGWLRRAAEVTVEDRAAQRAAYPGLTGRRYDGALDRVYQGVRNVIDKTGVAIAAEEGVENTRADLEDMVVKPETGPVDSEPDSVPIPLSRPDMIVPGDRPPGRRQSDVLLQGEWRTLIIGLRFDVLIRLREEAETTLVDLRVASRYGPHDLGQGAAYADSFLKSLDAELLGIAGG